ncbi:hypothetical protein N4T77_12610 [Clostridium sp. CX1]|uniref:hypothetical protein n=1 Tax=Clostridium sp. CX1 TaxID=2978346 RepID=UPI0021BFD9C3|nr:hypothetical protein [Clostridium sp. CX1]MCT8977445.1 hypothetical protein [Clostridium sp. CX1]
MKTISEIQSEIKGMSIRLSELFNELEDLKPKDNINKQTDFVKISQLAQRHPIKEHILEEADNYKKKLYLTMLSAIAQTNNDNREGKLIFLHRILSGIKYEGSFESVVKDGMEINDKIIGEFIKCMEDNESKQLFIFESLIISNLGGEIDDIAKKYISELIGNLGIIKEEAVFLIKLSAVVLEQDSNKYKKLVNIIPKIVDISVLLKSYLKDFVNGVICDTEYMYYIYGIDADEEVIKSIYDKDLGKIKLVLENVRFNMEIINENLEFKSIDSLVFNNCSFESSYRHYNEFSLFPSLEKYKKINFEFVKNIFFYKCKFWGFQKRIAMFNNSQCQNIKIEKCIFELCGCLIGESDRNLGGCFYIDTVNDFVLKDSEFSNCYIQHFSKGSYVDGAIAHIGDAVNNFEINNVIFTNCHCYCGEIGSLNIIGREKLFSISYRNNLINTLERFTNCEIINSGKLY